MRRRALVAMFLALLLAVVPGGALPGLTLASGASAQSTRANHHQMPTGWFLALLAILLLLYVGWRSGRLRQLLGAARATRPRGERRGIRVRPGALLPLALLVIVVVALLIDNAVSGDQAARGATLGPNATVTAHTSRTIATIPTTTISARSAPGESRRP